MNRQQPPFHFSYVPLLVRLKCLEPGELPAYLGSTLHGVMGWVLREQDKRTYRYLYENWRETNDGMDVPNPYVLVPPKRQERYQYGDVLQFQLLLLGNAGNIADQVCDSFVRQRIFILGAARKKFELVEILHGKELYPIWKPAQEKRQDIKISTVNNAAYKGCRNCSIHFLTPLRIRRNNELLLDIDFLVIIRNITRRITELAERYGGYVDLEGAEWTRQCATKIECRSAGLTLMPLERYSNRRSMKMDMSGLLGAMTFYGDLELFTPWLNAAEILHIGRNVTFGCGQIDVRFW